MDFNNTHNEEEIASRPRYTFSTILCQWNDVLRNTAWWGMVRVVLWVSTNLFRCLFSNNNRCDRRFQLTLDMCDSSGLWNLNPRFLTRKLKPEDLGFQIKNCFSTGPNTYHTYMSGQLPFAKKAICKGKDGLPNIKSFSWEAFFLFQESYV